MKRNAIARIIIWSLVAVLLTSLLVVGISSSPSSFFTGDWSFGIIGVTYKNSALYNVGGGTVTDEFHSIKVNWTNGKINIESYDGEDTVTSETEVAEKENKLRWRVEDGVLKIQQMAAGIRFGLKKTPKKTLTVKIPSSAAEKLKSVNTDSVSAEVNIIGVAASGKIEIDTVSGSAELKNIKTARLDIDTVSGEVNAEGEISELESDSVSGDITVSSAVSLEKLDCDSTSGNIRLTIPKDSGFTLKADTVSGDISCGLPTVSESKNRRVCGDGSADFETDTVSGDLIITSAE